MMRSKPSLHQRFYLPSESVEGGRVRFGREESKHMLASLRLGRGDLIGATDGAGKTYSIAIEDTARGLVSGRIQSVRAENEPRPGIWLFQGIIRPARMDTIVEQCVELGIACLVPVRSERSRESVSSARLDRWKRIAVEAMKQSLRSHLARINPPETVEGALALVSRNDLVLVASETEPGGLASLRAGVPKPAKVTLWVGPEGGFSDHETETLAGAGARFFSLGPHRLRSETAAAAAVALASAYFH